MKNYILTILLLLFFESDLLFANDGAFYAKGNQLIPINETQISMKKEVLQTFSIDKTFFKDAKDWFINGIWKAEEVKGYENSSISTDATKFHLQQGTIIFKKKNFKINGDLSVYAQNYLGIQNLTYIPFSYYQEINIWEPKNDFQRKILRNLPFARRGLVFKSQDLNDFYKKMDWYIPNPNYEPKVEQLTENEKKWVEKWR